MIKITNLCTGYSFKEILHHVNLTIPSGKITVIVGPNGCGKSTLLKTLCGILPIQSGTISLEEQNLATFTPQTLARRISYLAQNRQIPDITVQRMVLHGRFPYLSYPRRYRKEDLQIASDAMNRMGIADLADVPLSHLSGGTRQKVYIAMALAQNTPIVLFDEPTTYLDISHQLQTMEHARFLTSEDKTVVMVLHDLSMALQTADQLVVMNQGMIVTQGTPEEIYSSGCLDQIFGIKLKRIQTNTGWHYYYDSYQTLHHTTLTGGA
jgi:iron complex transport system ATP-binding protein